MSESALSISAPVETDTSPPPTSYVSTDEAVVGESKQSFVEEIRTDRLNLLWKATLGGSLLLIWLVIVVSAGTSSTSIQVFDFALPFAFILISSYATRYFLKQENYEVATWAYAIGLLAATSVLMVPSNNDSRTIVPALGILIIFLIGMLMSVRHTIFLLFVMYLAMIGLPLLVAGEFPVTSGGAFGFMLIGVAALVVTQVSGELYGIAEWALDSYRKERSTATKLHESQQAVEKSLLKQQNLTVQLQGINAELDDARKSAEMAKQFRGQFLANMSHELRTPLNAVIGFSETMLNFPMMYEGVELPKEYRQDMDRIYNSGKHLLGIINDILDLSRIDVGRLEIEIQPVALEPIINNLISTTLGLIGTKPVELKRTVPEEVPIVLGDPLRVRQVLLNLYSNAAKFTDEGHIRLIVTAETSRVVVAVEDTGSGISKENVDRIFDAFQQGESGRKQKRAGAGLGLAISRQLLELMEGQIWVESELGKGSTFYAAFPRYIPDHDSEWEEVAEHNPAIVPGQKE